MNLVQITFSLIKLARICTSNNPIDHVRIGWGGGYKLLQLTLLSYQIEALDPHDKHHGHCSLDTPPPLDNFFLNPHMTVNSYKITTAVFIFVVF